MALKGTHKKRIKEQMQQLGTWREEFAATVDACAKIMERQDGLLKLYKDQGNVPQTPDGKKSVTLQALEANERNLLSYLRALGLTPDTIKRMEKPKEKKVYLSSNINDEIQKKSVEHMKQVIVKNSVFVSTILLQDTTICNKI